MFDQSVPSCAEVKNEWLRPPTPSICVHEVDGDKFALL